MTTQILLSPGPFSQASDDSLNDYLLSRDVRSLLLVCGPSAALLPIDSYFRTLQERRNIRVVRFCEFQPNPDWNSVVAGVECFQGQSFDLIVALGGGSAMDVAKCIRLYGASTPRQHYSDTPIAPADVPLLAIPTTAGTGSEATRYAVVYDRGEKQSITHERCLPETVLLDPRGLQTLPPYQRAATMMDAFCHGVESFWSVRSTAESQALSREAIRRLMEAREAYLQNDPAGNDAMLQAAHLAGRAIDLTQTTAGHAMCYRLTGLYGIAHGHAAALCTAALFFDLTDVGDRCVDSRGLAYVKQMLTQLSQAMGCRDPEEAARTFAQLLPDTLRERPLSWRQEDLATLADSVNPLRLKNHPVRLQRERRLQIYRQILEGQKETI